MAGRKSEAADAPSCDWRTPEVSEPVWADRSRIYRHKGSCSWRGVKPERYKQDDGGWQAIARHVLIGARGEGTRFHVRYFEIEPGGYSSLEHHRHEHVVICVKGEGKVRIGKRLYALKNLDTVYIAPDDAHQLTNPFKEPFGFLCIVNARRDKPKKVKRKMEDGKRKIEKSKK